MHYSVKILLTVYPHYIILFRGLRQCRHIKGAIGNAADISNKLIRIAFLFTIFIRDSKFEIPLYEFNEIEQQTDVCFLILM